MSAVTQEIDRGTIVEYRGRASGESLTSGAWIEGRFVCLGKIKDHGRRKVSIVRIGDYRADASWERDGDAQVYEIIGVDLDRIVVTGAISKLPLAGTTSRGGESLSRVPGFFRGDLWGVLNYAQPAEEKDVGDHPGEDHVVHSMRRLASWLETTEGHKLWMTGPAIPSSYAACAECGELVPMSELEAHACPDVETLAEIDAAAETIPDVVYPLSGIGPELPPPAKTWLRSTGERWIAVVDGWEVGQTETRPIAEPPTSGTLVYAFLNNDGDLVEIEKVLA